MTTSLAAIHVAKKQLGLDDDTYRAKLRTITGKESARDLTEEERERVITQFRRDGFRTNHRRKDGRLKLSGRFAPKLQALWIAAYNLGIVRNRDDAALVDFVRRQTGIDHIRFVKHGEDAAKAIEALKAMMTREASVKWRSATRGTAIDYQDADWFRIIQAQWVILHGKSDRIAMWAEIDRLCGWSSAFKDIGARKAQIVMNEFGRRIRNLAAAKSRKEA